MLDLTIRPATPLDGEIIAAFNSRLALETESRNLDPDVVRAGVTALLTDPSKGRYFVACVGEWIVGQAMITWEWSDWRNGMFWWLQSVYVDPEFRRQGVFRALCQHVFQLARETPGVAGIRLYVEEENHAAQQTYVSLGFEAAGYVVFEKEIDA